MLSRFVDHRIRTMKRFFLQVRLLCLAIYTTPPLLDVYQIRYYWSYSFENIWRPTVKYLFKWAKTNGKGLKDSPSRFSISVACSVERRTHFKIVFLFNLGISLGFTLHKWEQLIMASKVDFFLSLLFASTLVQLRKSYIIHDCVNCGVSFQISKRTCIGKLDCFGLRIKCVD